MTRHTATARRNAARFFAAGLVAAGLVGGGFAAGAQPKTPPAAPPAQSPMPPAATKSDDKADPVVAKVGAEVIHLSDLNTAAEALPPQARQMTRDQLLPKLLEQMVDTRALAIEARKENLDKDPRVERTIHDAVDRTLVSALLEREIGPHVTDLPR